MWVNCARKYIEACVGTEQWVWRGRALGEGWPGHTCEAVGGGGGDGKGGRVGNGPSRDSGGLT